MTDSILSSLAEAITWCSRPGRGDDLVAALRTPTLKPSAGVTGLERLCQHRRQLIAAHHVLAVPVEAGLKTGRIVAVLLDDVIGCQTASTASGGFFDEQDCPGWDSWFCHGNWGNRSSCLFCWIPQAFHEMVEAAMAATPTENIHWVESLDSIRG
jgi:hypothetical protein